MSNKLSKVAIALSLAASLVLPVAHAQTTSVSDLQAQIAALQAQLAALSGSASTSYTFTRNLTVGSRGADVSALQSILITGGYLNITTPTGYFGPLTKAAVARWQAAVGLPATGYFGPLSRAKVAATVVVTVPPTTPPTTTPPTTVPPSTTTGLTVSVGTNNPTAATVIADVDGAQALIPTLSLRFTGNGTVTSLRLQRTGISADSDIDNVYLFDVDGRTRLAEMSSMSGGVVTFTNAGGLFTVSGERTVVVRYDLNRNATAGKTIAFSLVSAADVTGNVAVAGSFPITGNNMTVAVVTDLARLTLAGQNTSSSVDPGSVAFEAFKFTLQAQNQNVRLWSLRLTSLGSVDNAQLANFKLWDGGVQIGSTVAAMAADKTITFDFGTAGYLIQSGNTRNFRVTVDVVGGATRTIQLSIQRPSDIIATDAAYNVNIKPDTGTVGVFAVTSSDTDSVAAGAQATTINAGSVTITLSGSSPSGNVPLNATDVELARYDVRAVGEDVRISSVDIQITDGTTTWDKIKDVKVVYDGSQVGTTQASLEEDADTTITTNFVIPAGVTKTLSIRATIASPSGTSDAIANNDTVKAILDVGSSNAQRMTSLGTFNFPLSDVEGNTLTVSSSALTGAINPSQGAVTVTNGSTQQVIGSYLLTAGAAEGVSVTSITFDDGNAAGNAVGTQALGTAFQNLNVFQGATRLSPTSVTTSTSDAATTTYTVNLSPALNVPANTTVQINLVADVLATDTWTDGERTRISSATGTGLVTGSAANISSAVYGQTVTTAAAGTLTVNVDSTTPVSTQHVMGSTNRTLAAWRFEANTTEDLSVNQVIVTADANGGNYKNLKLFVDGVQVDGTVPALSAATSGQAVFGSPSGAAMFTIPRGSTKVVTLRADITSFADGATSNVATTFTITPPSTITGVATEGVIARGTSSGNYALVTAASASAKSSNAQYVVRTTFTTVSLACAGSCTNRVRATTDTVGTLTLTGTSSADAQIRAALQANDEADGGAAGNDWVSTGTTHSFTTNNVVDGTNSLRITEDATSAVADHTHFDFGTSHDLDNYSKLSFWITSSAAKAAGDMTAVLSVTADTTDDATLNGLGANPVTVNLPLLAAGTKQYVELNLSGFTTTNTYRFLTFNIAAGVDNSATIDIDNIRLYNDSITVDISGELNAAATVDGTPVRLTNAGGTTVAIGYIDATSTSAASVVITGGDDIGNAAAAVPTAGLISVGATAQTFNVITNTSTLMESSGTDAQADALSFSIDLGNPSTAGDIRWYDQAVTSTSPITWLNGTTPVVINLSY